MSAEDDVGRQVEVGRATTRYLIRGREWTRSHPELAAAALGQAATDWSGRFVLTSTEFPEEGSRAGAADNMGTEAAREALARAFAKRDVMVEAFRAAGGLGRELGDDKCAVLCPWRDQHTTNTDGTSSTIVTRAGWFYCSHAHCRGRTVVGHPFPLKSDPLSPARGQDVAWPDNSRWWPKARRDVRRG